MILYPTLELKDGRTVSLNSGRIDEEPHLWHVDPVEKAQEFAAAGAEWMHLTDLDAVDGDGRNTGLVTEIIRKAHIPVQLAGGIRTREQAEGWLDLGAGRLVIGSLATRDPDFVRELAKYHPDQIVLAVDVWQGRVMADGWRNQTAFEPATFIRAFEGVPLAAVLVTDIDTDVADGEASLSLVTELAGVASVPVIASGIVRSLDDISRLKYVRNVGGVIVGRALMRRDVDLAEALALVAEPLEPAAEFI